MKFGGPGEVAEVQGIAGDIGLGPATVLARVSRAGDGPSNVLVRSHSLAVGLSILGFASPVLFVVGGWMDGVGCRGLSRIRVKLWKSHLFRCFDNILLIALGHFIFLYRVNTIIPLKKEKLVWVS
ncbi:MAG: hypothetical protein NTV68_00440 [Methanomicrobiales archaeon]|nr:hypothetical protein [Methanomicrobiales archaeon]